MFFGFLSMDNLIFIVTALLIVLFTIIADRLVRRAINRYTNRLSLDLHASNILKLIFRIIVFSGGLIAFMTLFNIGMDWFFGRQ